MKSLTLALVPIAVCCCAAAFAQDTQEPSHTTTYGTPQGPLVVHWGQPDARQFGPAPAFAQLDRGGAGYLTGDEADAYPPLGNDFIHADRNRDGRISRAEYERWVASTQ
jgi:hypothetical protein